jgi:hypothetical protein
MTVEHLRFLDLDFRIEVPCSEDLLWLEEFLAPAFSTVTEPRSPVDVVLRIDPERVDGWLAEGPTGDDLAAFRLDQGVARLPAWRADDREHRAWDERSAAFYQVRPDLRRVEVWCRQPGKRARRALMRAVREVAIDHSARFDGVLLHASCLDCGSGAIAFSGPKGAGKTTLLIAALVGTRSAFVANDRVFVDLRSDPPRAASLPSIVSVRASTARLFPELAGRLHGKKWSPWLRWQDLPDLAEPADHPSSKAHQGMSPFQFRRWLDCDAESVAPLRLIALPSVGDVGSPPRMRRLSVDEVRDRLPSLLFSSGADERSELFALEPRGSFRDRQASYSTLAARVPVVELSLPRGRVESATWFEGLARYATAA